MSDFRKIKIGHVGVGTMSLLNAAIHTATMKSATPIAREVSLDDMLLETDTPLRSPLPPNASHVLSVLADEAPVKKVNGQRGQQNSWLTYYERRVSAERPEVPVPDGLKRFIIDDKEVYAINLKNAIRKAQKNNSKTSENNHGKNRPQIHHSR